MSIALSDFSDHEVYRTMDFLFDALTLATLAHVFLAVTIEKWPMSPVEG